MDESALYPYQAHGWTAESHVGHQAVGDCPFCDKHGHFYVNTDNGQYHCQRCSASGNTVTFLDHVAETAVESTDREAYARLSKLRGIKSTELKSAELGWNGTRWLLPVRAPSGHVQDIRIWNERTRQMLGTKGCKTAGWNAGDLLSPRKTAWPVWICEGEWDGIALRALARTLKLQIVVVAVPGAGTFKADWVRWFNGRDVVLAYDADEAGDLGMAKVGTGTRDDAGKINKPGMLSSCTKSLSYVRWLASFPEGFDVRDLVTAAEFTPSEAWQGLQEMLSVRPRRDPLPNVRGRVVTARPAASDATAAVPPVVTGDRPTFEAVVERFKKWVQVDDDFAGAVKVALSVSLATQLGGDPLWLYLVAPPGGGKTLIVNSFRSAPATVYRSTLTANSLVSGYPGNPDPSLMAILDGKLLVLKDFTEVLDLPTMLQDQVFGTLRGAYDGSVERTYGNGVQRNYKARFGMLAACTHRIHGLSKTSVGERFLKYQMVSRAADKHDGVIWAAMNGVGKETEMEADLEDAVGRFTDTQLDVDALTGRVPEWAMHRILALSQIVALLRGDVARNDYTGVVAYRPQREVGSRLAKQLVKLGNVLSAVSGTPSLTAEDYLLLERVAFDTAIGWNLDVVQAFMQHQDGEEPMDRKTLAERSDLPATNVGRRLEDMIQLGIVRSFKDRKTSEHSSFVSYQLCPEVRDLWRRAAVGSREHVRRAVMVRRRRKKP